MWLRSLSRETASKIPDTTKDLLQERLLELRRRFSARSFTYRASIGFGALLLAACPILWLLGAGRGPALGAFAYGAGILIVGWMAFSPKEIELEMRQVEDELDLLGIGDTSREQRAQKLLKLHQSELKRYYDQTLRQSSIIFVAGLGCILLGFVVIGGSLYVVWHSPGGEMNQKLILGGLGAIGGVLSNFVAAMYLKMFTQTVLSLTEFHKRLVSTHDLYFVNFLTAKISYKWNRYNTVLEEIATDMVGRESHKRKTTPQPSANGKEEDEATAGVTPSRGKSSKKTKGNKPYHTSSRPEKK